MDYNAEIKFVKGVGEKRAKLYARLGIFTVWDLINHFPRAYHDFSEPMPISALKQGENGVFKARVVNRLAPRKFSAVSVYKAVLSDGLSEIVAVIFNNEFSFRRLVEGEEFIFSGKIGGTFLRPEITNPEFITPDGAAFKPRYALTAGLYDGTVAANVKTVLGSITFGEPLSEEIRKKYELCGFKEAMWGIHFPNSREELDKAKRRLVFQELLSLRLGLAVLKSRNRTLSGAKMSEQSIAEFARALSFSLTEAQKRSIREGIADMCGNFPMNRLLQGDVGSGKTAVAAALCYFAAKNDYQSAFMAPTEILAVQHYNSLSKLLEPLGIKVELLVGAMPAAEKKAVRARIKSGEAQIAVGTHTLIQKNTNFDNLGFAVTDEQHRFGVNQRAELLSKGNNPHNLVMSATPIPRTLALMIYGDLDISVLDEMPKGRLPVKTYRVDKSFRPRLYKFISKYAKKGKQAYIICPLIEESESEKASAEEYYRTAVKELDGASVGLLHGKLSAADKESVMSDFVENKISVLVATTVVEVGVDVPNAVIMMIENAEQFGLSQLHQLRGRVGRGAEQSFCVLVNDSDSELSKARIDILTKTTDGFAIANEDLKLRGPGDFFGSKQHGLPTLKIADMSQDLAALTQAQETAEIILSEDPRLCAPENAGLSALVRNLFKKGEENGFS